MSKDKFVKLSKFTLKDINQKYLKWVNDKSLIKFTSIKKKYNFEDLKKYVEDNTNNQNSHLFKVLYKNIHIGNIRISKLIYNYATIGILIGEKNYSNKGIATIAIKKILNYAKRKKFKKIYIFLNKKNRQSFRIFEKNKFLQIKNIPKYISIQKSEILLEKKII